MCGRTRGNSALGLRLGYPSLPTVARPSRCSAVTCSFEIAAGRLMKPNGLTGAIASSLPLVGKIASKVVEGGANALFARFLGKRAIREFQPVAY